MSLFSIKDFYPSDILSDLKLKPWWETLRGFGYVAGVASMLSLLIATFPSVTVSCLSVAENTNESNTLTDLQAAAINSYCVSYMPWYVKYSGLLALSVMVLLYVSEAFWTFVPGVRESLTNLSKISEKICEINMRIDEMKTQSVLPITKSASDKDLKLRDIVMLLIRPFNSVNVMSWYVGRSFILLAFLVTLSGLNLLAYFEFNFNTSFLCNVQGDFTQNAGNATNALSCIVSASSIYLLIYSIALAFQAFFTFVGLNILVIWSVKNAIILCKSDDSWNEADDIGRKHALQLLSLFLSYRNPDLADDVRSFTKFVLSKDFRTEQSHVIDEAIIANDFEFFRILKLSYEKTGVKAKFAKDVASIADLVLRDGENPKEFKIGATEEEEKETDADYKIFNLLINLLPHHQNQTQNKEKNKENGGNHQNQTQNKEKNKENGGKKNELLELSIGWREKNQWHLLACSPIFYTNHFDKEFKDYNLFDEFDIKFDQLDKEGRSFLFYVLRNSSMNRFLNRFALVFDVLLQKTKHLESAKFVHFDGRSMLAKDFFHDQYKDRFRGQLPDLKLCEVGNNSIGSNSQTELQEIYKKYRELTNLQSN